MKFFNPVLGTKTPLAEFQGLKQPGLKRTLLCGVLFQLGWFVCILGSTWMWLVYSTAFVFFYAVFISSSRTDFIFALIVAVTGSSIDLLLSSLGVFQFPHTFIPLWLMALWLLFALSMPYAFSFLRKRYVLAALVGGVGASTSYFAAISLRGDVDLMQPEYVGFMVVAAYWAVLFPSALYLYEYFVRRQESDTVALKGGADNATWS